MSGDDGGAIDAKRVRIRGQRNPGNRTPTLSASMEDPLTMSTSPNPMRTPMPLLLGREGLSASSTRTWLLSSTTRGLIAGALVGEWNRSTPTVSDGIASAARTRILLSVNRAEALPLCSEMPPPRKSELTASSDASSSSSTVCCCTAGSRETTARVSLRVEVSLARRFWASPPLMVSAPPLRTRHCSTGSPATTSALPPSRSPAQAAPIGIVSANSRQRASGRREGVAAGKD